LSAPDGITPIVLAQNEHTRPPSQRVRDAIAQAIDASHLYADTDCSELRRAIAAVHGLEVERVFCGSGSMELMSALVQCYLSPSDRILMSEYSYLFMRTLARMVGATVDIAAERDYRVDVDALLDAVRPETRMVFMVNPGNPCGTVVEAAEVRRLREGLPDHVLLLLDEAYAEYVEADDDRALFDLAERGNTVITRTFSKIYGLAGLRVGWGYFPAPILHEVRKVLLPGGVALLSQAAARAAIEDRAAMAEAWRDNARHRDMLSRGLEDLGLLAVASQTNFVLADFGTPERAVSAFDALRARGIIVRPMGGYGLPSCLRVTVSVEAHMRQTLDLLHEWRDEFDGG
jgi:histidinol-phosphate aminotransferase